MGQLTKAKERTYSQEQLDEAVNQAVADALGDQQRRIEATVAKHFNCMTETMLRETVAQSMIKACTKIAQDKLRAMDFLPVLSGIITTQVSLSLQGIDFAGKTFGDMVRSEFDAAVDRAAKGTHPAGATEALALSGAKP